MLVSRSAARCAENEPLPIPFICECQDKGCAQIVRLTIRVRAHGKRFFASAATPQGQASQAPVVRRLRRA